MTRLSGDELRDGYVWNGFDYALQVWVVDGVAQSLRPPGGDAARRAPAARRSAWPAAASRRFPVRSAAVPRRTAARDRAERITPGLAPRPEPPRPPRVRGAHPHALLFRCPGRTAC